MSETLNSPAPEPAERTRTIRTTVFTRPADQLRTSLIPTLGAALLLVAYLAVVHQINLAKTAELAQANPAFREAIEAQAAGLETTLAAGAVLYLFGVLVVGLVHSRRLMGALFAMHRRIRRLAEGDLATRFRLRRGDYFHDVAESINEAAAEFHRQAAADLADLTDLIAILDRSPHAGPLRDGLRESLEEMRARKSRLLKLGGEPAVERAGVLTMAG